MKSYCSVGIILFVCCIQHTTKALKTVNGRGLYRINAASNEDKVNNNIAVTESKSHHRETSRDLFEEDNHA
jgi:hypothetical protein